MEYYSAINNNEIIPSAATWMNLEIFILNEVSQTEKDKYMIPFICGIDRKKIQINFFITQEEINRHRK